MNIAPAIDPDKKSRKASKETRQQQLIECIAFAAERRPTHAHAQVDVGAAKTVVEFVQGVLNSMHELRRLVATDLKDRDELVSGIAAHKIGRANQPVEQLSGLSEELIWILNKLRS